MTQTDAITETRDWLQAMVVGLNLCPFAAAPLSADRVRIAICDKSDQEPILHALAEEMEHLLSSDQLETTLLVLPDALADFGEYNDFLELTEQLLSALELEGVLQIASFHPNYQFADTEADDVENYTNRSPYPMLHILREASVSAAVDSHPDVDRIPERNIAKLRELGLDSVKVLLDL